jgi:hypothetical protein
MRSTKHSLFNYPQYSKGWSRGLQYELKLNPFPNSVGNLAAAQPSLCEGPSALKASEELNGKGPVTLPDGYHRKPSSGQQLPVASPHLSPRMSGLEMRKLNSLKAKQQVESDALSFASGESIVQLTQVPGNAGGFQRGRMCMCFRAQVN